MKVGDLVWVTGHPRDGWQRFMGVIVNKEGFKYTVVATSTHMTYSLYRSELEPMNESG